MDDTELDVKYAKEWNPNKSSGMCHVYMASMSERKLLISNELKKWGNLDAEPADQRGYESVDLL